MLPRFGITGTKMTNKIGIFGGTFNPVHKAHLKIAKEFIEKFSLDLLYIIPNNVPPMKEIETASGKDRMEMLKIAFLGNHRIVISDIEMKREGTSYTCDTIALLRKIHPYDELFLLTGDDWVGSFDKWKNYQYILQNASLVIATRSGENTDSALDRLEALSGKRPKLLGNEKLELSSTEFRANLKEELLPDGVYDYIKSRRLYGI